MEEYCEELAFCRRRAFKQKFGDDGPEVPRCRTMCDNCKVKSGAIVREIAPPLLERPIVEKGKGFRTAKQLMQDRKENQYQDVENINDVADDDGGISSTAWLSAGVRKKKRI